jgi:hypothetical protein
MKEFTIKAIYTTAIISAVFAFITLAAEYDMPIIKELICRILFTGGSILLTYILTITAKKLEKTWRINL